MQDDFAEPFETHFLPDHVIVLLNGRLLGVDEKDRTTELVSRCIREHELTIDQIDRLEVRNVMLAMQEPGLDHLDEDPMELIQIVYGGPGLPHGMKLAIAD